MNLSTRAAGTTNWFDLPATNLLDAMSFYEALLHWEFVQMQDSLDTNYVMVRINGTLIGGLRQVQNPPTVDNMPPAPVLYFTVDHLEEKITRAKELGAKLIGGIVNLGEHRGRYQWLRDRQNNVIGLWSAQ